MKKLLLGLLGLSFLAGCSYVETTPEQGSSQKNEIDMMSTLSVSGVVTAGQYDLAKGKTKLSNLIGLATETQTPSQENIDEAAKVYESTKALFEKTIETETLTSDLEGYASLQQITYDGQVYKLYIAETSEQKEEEEFKVRYNGIILANDTQYQYEAVMEVESEKNESEQENTFKIIVDETTYVSIKTEEEIEDNEQETSYQYQVVKNGNVIDSFKAELEVENNETEVKVVTLTQQFKFKSVIHNDVLYLRVKDGTNQYTLEWVDGTYQLSTVDFNSIEDQADHDKVDDDDDKDDIDDDDDDPNDKDDDLDD